ncbi:hypothetical protein L3X38_045208 [Prunus dulcis]|uniref:Uncharacterized protein n=1 Tax=Prunus dulcis TaxID=3755 RepID=A0AAD4V1V5_PRUDU|nr:hypothetical protein L3X38_045208 [Prunus dulcis]
MLRDGILWCLGGGALFLLGFHIDSEARKLESVRRIRELKDLVGLLRYECRVVVAVRGRVCSATPINCEKGGLQGVIVEQRAEQYFLERIKNMDK